MTPFFSTLVGRFWPYLLIAVLLLTNWLTMDLAAERGAQLRYYKAAVKALGDAAEARQVETEARQDQNLETVKENHDEEHIEAVRAGAVAAFARRVRQPAAGSGAMPGIAGSVGKDDGASEKCRPDPEFIADAAEDADSIAAWQEWARLNQIPVRD